MEMDLCIFYRSYIFFFQAEDGIRAFHVTGVQTCALPIFQRVEQPDHVADDVELRIGFDRRGSIAAAVAAHVGREGAEAGLRQCRQLTPPRIPGLRPAVAEQDRGPLAHVRHMQANAVRLDDAMLGVRHCDLSIRAARTKRRERSTSARVHLVAGASASGSLSLFALTVHAAAAPARTRAARPTARARSQHFFRQISTFSTGLFARLRCSGTPRQATMRRPSSGEASWVSWCSCARGLRARSRPASTPTAAASRARAAGPFISTARIARRPTASRSRKAGSTITPAACRRSPRPPETALAYRCSTQVPTSLTRHSFERAWAGRDFCAARGAWIEACFGRVAPGSPRTA